MKISAEDKEWLDANRSHWDLWDRAQIFNQLDSATRDGYLNMIRKYYNPGYITNMWCSPCVVDMMKYLYTQYDKSIQAGEVE
jgi:hypothetical protein